MFGRLALLLLVIALAGADGVSRSGAAAQRELNNFSAPLRCCVNNLSPQTETLPIEVFQILDLPVNIHEASLTKNDRGFYFLKLSLANSSELKMIGLRYSLARIDSRNEIQALVNRTEAVSLRGYGIKTVTFKSPVNFKQKDGERLLLMIEQVLSRESIWEVVKAKDALEAYARGDYSVMPTVLRVANQVDSPPFERIKFLPGRRN
jgi:hypothetical protein